MTQQTFIPPGIKMDFRVWAASHRESKITELAKLVPQSVITMRSLSDWLKQGKTQLVGQEFYDLCALLAISTSRELVKSTL